MRIRGLVTTGVLVVAASAVAPGQVSRAPGAAPTVPHTDERPVSDTYHGTKVIDPYRWLDDWNDPAVRRWADAQNLHTRTTLDAWPSADAVRERVKAVGGGPQRAWRSLVARPGALFALETKPPLDQPLLVVMRDAADPSAERVVVDPNRIDPSGATTIDFYVPSRDGRLVAVSLSVGGTEDGTLHVFEVATGRELPDRVPRANGGTAGGSVAWAADGGGFYYTHYPRSGERPVTDREFYQQIWFHAIGTPADADTYALGADFPRIAETELQGSRDGRVVHAAVKNGDGGDVEHFVRVDNGGWRQLARVGDRVTALEFGPGGEIFAVSHRDAPHGAVLKLPRDATSLTAARVIYRAATGDITEIAATAGRLYLVQVVGGPCEFRAMDFDGGALSRVDVPPLANVSELAPLEGGDLLFRTESYVEPVAWRRAGRDGTVSTTALAQRSPVDFSGIEVERAEAVSKDGTRVPMSIVHRNGIARDGRNPAILYGYGGFRSSQSPRFSATLMPWLEQGGLYVVANTRGGTEFGDEWHRGGMLTRKQNVFDDFAACARWLIDRRYTSTPKLAFMGGSNGGILMGAMITQHPSLARAVVSQVGIYDMLRYDTWPNGQFNVTELGSARNADQFSALFAYSPYERVTAGTAYPAILLLSGTNDPRVNPGDSRRFAARLQAATASDRPVLLRVSGAGHIGTSLSEGLAQIADIDIFLFQQLGVAYNRVP